MSRAAFASSLFSGGGGVGACGARTSGSGRKMKGKKEIKKDRWGLIGVMGSNLFGSSRLSPDPGNWQHVKNTCGMRRSRLLGSFMDPT